MSKRTQNQTKPKFKHTRKNLCVIRSDSEKWKIADYIRVTAYGRDPASNQWLAQIKFQDCDGKCITSLIPRGELSNPRIMKDFLLNSGYVLPGDKEESSLVLKYLADASPEKRITITERTGWLDRHYVFPETVIGPQKSAVVYEPLLQINDPRDATSGTLEDWQDQVASNAAHSSRMSFAICTSLSASIMNMSDVESGGFNFVGESSRGKTTTLRAALSIYERAGHGDLPTWDITSAGLDEFAVKHCDRILVLDEIARLSPDDKKAAQTIRDAAYRLASGKGRIRSAYFKNKGNPTQWRTIFLSSSEFALFELARSAGKDRLKGEEVRFIDIPAIVNKEYGVFETVPEGSSPSALAEKIEAACSTFYGVAGRQFIHQIVKKYDRVKIQLNNHIDEFLKLAVLPDNGWERRFAKRFALAYAAGRLGIQFKILPWSDQLVQDACLACYRDARQAIPDFEEQLTRALNTLRRKLRKRDLFKDLRKNAETNNDVPHRKAPGFIKLDKKEGLFYAIKPRKFEQWCGEVVPYRLIAQHLREQGHLVTTSRDLPTKQILVKGIKGKMRYYCVKKAFLES